MEEGSVWRRGVYGEGECVESVWRRRVCGGGECVEECVEEGSVWREALTWTKGYPFEGCLGEEAIVLGLQGTLHISTDLRTCVTKTTAIIGYCSLQIMPIKRITGVLVYL